MLPASVYYKAQSAPTQLRNSTGIKFSDGYYVLATLVDTSGGDARPGTDATRWCVGITVDPERGKFYWTQKGSDNAERGRIFRANVEMSKGQSPAARSDIEVLFDGLPEPIDLELDRERRVLYWTDRGDPPRGNTVNRASVDGKPKPGQKPEIVLTHLMEGIGLALDEICARPIYKQ